MLTRIYGPRVKYLCTTYVLNSLLSRILNSLIIQNLGALLNLKISNIFKSHSKYSNVYKKPCIILGF